MGLRFSLVVCIVVVAQGCSDSSNASLAPPMCTATDCTSGSMCSANLCVSCQATSACEAGVTTLTPSTPSASFTASIATPGKPNHDYAVFTLDATGFPNGGQLRITGTVGSSGCAASFNLNDSQAPFTVSGVPTGSLATAYDISPGSSFSLIYNFAGPHVFRFGAEGNWLTSGTNSVSFTATVTTSQFQDATYAGSYAVSSGTPSAVTVLIGGDLEVSDSNGLLTGTVDGSTGMFTGMFTSASASSAVAGTFQPPSASDATALAGAKVNFNLQGAPAQGKGTQSWTLGVPGRTSGASMSISIPPFLNSGSFEITGGGWYGVDATGEWIPLRFDNTFVSGSQWNFTMSGGPSPSGVTVQVQGDGTFTDGSYPDATAASGTFTGTFSEGGSETVNWSAKRN